MAAITDLSDLINRSTGGNSGTPENLFFHKQARIAGAAATAPIGGRPSSLWLYDGQPCAGAVPTTVAVPTNATNGTLKQTTPGGSREKWLTQFWATGFVSGTLLLYDRLLHIGGLDATVTTEQTVGGTITRNTGGVGNFVFAEIYTTIGTTARTITMNYTNQAGTDSRTSAAVAIGSTSFREATRCIFLPLQSGDSGVQEVAGVTLSASTGTAGEFGVTIGKPIAYAPIGVGGGCGFRDFTTGLPGLPLIDDDAALALIWFAVAGTTPEFFGGASFIEA
jgi:hypothetical protein